MNLTLLPKSIRPQEACERRFTNTNDEECTAPSLDLVALRAELIRTLGIA